jgi:selenide,water dikinase
MAQKGGVGLRFFFDALPFVAGAVEYADQWLFPAGTCNNENAYKQTVSFDGGFAEEMRQLLFTPETSGGLLAAVPPDKLDTLLALFAGADHACWVVGEVVDGAGIEVT